MRFHVDVALGILAIVWCVMRLLGLETSPPGLSMDEALAGMHVQCLAETGQSADGKPWPLFPTGFGGGLYTPVYMLSLYGWTRVFGISIASLRGMNAAYSIFAIVGLWFLTRRLAGARTAFLVVVAAALSPWSFQLSRLAADSPVVPAFLVWATYFFLRSTRAVSAALGGIGFALAAYSYPPTRVQAPLLVILLLILERKPLRRRRVLAFFGSGLILSLPLIKRILDGTLMGRSNALSILATNYIAEHRGALSPPLFVISQLFDNLHEHLRPSYLFFTGDPNLRHSTQAIGQLGWLDTLAAAIAMLAVAIVISRALRPNRAEREPTVQSLRLWRLAALAVVVGGFGTLPAALCWEGLPHSYRSIGVYPAVAVFTGACLAAVWNRSRLIPIAALALAIGQTLTFLPDYFGAYRQRASSWFDADLRLAAERGDKAEFERIGKSYPKLGVSYYLMINFGHNCRSSIVEAERLGAKD